VVTDDVDIGLVIRDIGAGVRPVMQIARIASPLHTLGRMRALIASLA
jgi:hypothetical protein